MKDNVALEELGSSYGLNRNSGGRVEAWSPDLDAARGREAGDVDLGVTGVVPASRHDPQEDGGPARRSAAAPTGGAAPEDEGAALLLV